MRKLVGLLVVSAACGSDPVHHLADAPATADARPDGLPGIDAALLPVTITISRDGVSEPNIKVYFQAPDSTEISSTITDANGVASALMPAGGFVTAVDPFPPLVVAVVPIGNHTLKTFADVKPGDHLMLTNPSTIVPIANVTINLPIDPATPSYYYVYSTCEQSQTYVAAPAGSGAPVNPTTTAALYGCPATADFLVISYDQAGVPLNTFTAPGLAVADQGTVDLTGATYVGVPLVTFNVSNVPTLFSYVDYYLTLAAPSASYYTHRAMYAYPTLTAGSTSAQLGVPIGTPFLEDVYLGGSAFGSHDLYRWGALPAGDGSYSYDVTGRPLVDIATYPTFDQPTNTIGWTTNNGATPDLYVGKFTTTRTETNGSGSQVLSYFDWTITGGYTAAAIKPPTLPADAAVYNAITGDTAYVYDVVLAKLPGGYDAVRAHMIDVYDNDNVNPSTLVAGPSGHVEVERSQNLLAVGLAKTTTASPKRSRWVAPKVHHAKRR